MEQLTQYLAQAEALKELAIQHGIQALQNDQDIPVHVLVALPRVRQIVSLLRQALAQAQQVQANAQQS